MRLRRSLGKTSVSLSGAEPKAAGNLGETEV